MAGKMRQPGSEAGRQIGRGKRKHGLESVDSVCLQDGSLSFLLMLLLVIQDKTSRFVHSAPWAAYSRGLGSFLRFRTLPPCAVKQSL